MESQVQTSSRDVEARTRREPAQPQPPQHEQPFVVPPVDVFENESGITLLADLPGVSREQLAVRVDGDTLHVEGSVAPQGPAQMELLYGEVQAPSYRRQFTLSRELDASRIEASLKDGVLRLTIPKLEEAKPRRIEIRAS